MADEPMVDDREISDKPSSQWMPALKPVFALVATLIIIVLLSAIVRFIAVFFHDPLTSWTNSAGDNPYYSALFYLLYGSILFLLAVLLAGIETGGNIGGDRLRLVPDRQKMALFVNGAIIGIAATVAVYFIWTLLQAFAFGGHFYTMFMPDLFLTAAFLVIPELVFYTGVLVLVQGYFQRTLMAKNNDMVVGMAVTAMIYLILYVFIFNVWWLFSLQYFVDVFLTGIIIAFLFNSSKSLYMPIGFIMLWTVSEKLYYAFLNIMPGFYHSVFGRFYEDIFLYSFNQEILVYLCKIAILILVLAFISRSDVRDLENILKKLAGRVKTAAGIFLSRITRD